MSIMSIFISEFPTPPFEVKSKVLGVGTSLIFLDNRACDCSSAKIKDFDSKSWFITVDFILELLQIGFTEGIPKSNWTSRMIQGWIYITQNNRAIDY